MADRIYRDEATPGAHASPGLSGAIKDAVGALAKTFAPKSLVHFDANTNKSIDSQSGAEDTRINAGETSP